MHNRPRYLRCLRYLCFLRYLGCLYYLCCLRYLSLSALPKLFALPKSSARPKLSALPKLSGIGKPLLSDSSCAVCASHCPAAVLPLGVQPRRRNFSSLSKKMAHVHPIEEVQSGKTRTLLQVSCADTARACVPLLMLEFMLLAGGMDIPVHLMEARKECVPPSPKASTEPT